MRPTICARCKKNPAVIFITKIENGESTNEGLCLKCAKELNIKPVEDIIKKMGLSDEDLDNLTDEMVEAMGGVESLAEVENADEDGKTATFPFLNRLFNGPEDAPDKRFYAPRPRAEGRSVRRPEYEKTKIPGKLLHIPDAARREGKLDR
jgi:hypothetical protein